MVLKTRSQSLYTLEKILSQKYFTNIVAFLSPQIEKKAGSAGGNAV